MLKSGLLFIILAGCCGPVVAQVTKQSYRQEISRGEDFLRRFMPPQALEKYKAAIRMATLLHEDSLYTLALFGAGQALWYKGDFTDAANTVQDALQRFKKEKDLYNTAAAMRILSNIYDDQGDYENAFKIIQQALELYQNYHDDRNEVLSITQMGALYKNIGDYEAAMGYYNKAMKMKPSIGDYPYRELNHRIGELYTAKGMIDSSRYFYHKAFNGNPNSKTIRLCIGETYLLQHKMDSAFACLESLLGEARMTTDVNIMIPASIYLSKIYVTKRDLQSALRLAKEALELSEQRGQRQNKRDAYELLSVIYEAGGDAKNALQYQKLFQRVKDSVITDQFKGQLYSFKQKAAEAEQILAFQAQKRLTKRSVILVSLLAVLIFVLLTLRHKNEKLYLRQRASELEMQALRAQITPHFIFNCLTAINHFVLKHETETASLYLTRFSRLLRLVLVNAGKTTVTLEEELGMLRLYLNMEQLRFKEAFDYTIETDPDVQPSMITVPSLLLQPFCENAIWHGLLHKKGKGQLRIRFQREEGILLCTIKDNGIGRAKAAYHKQSGEKQASLGLKLSADRLALFNGEKTGAASFVIRDVKDEEATGTIVILKIKQPAGV